MCCFFLLDFVFRSIEVYFYAYEGVSFSSSREKPVYVITLTFCHLLIDSPVTRQTG